MPREFFVFLLCVPLNPNQWADSLVFVIIRLNFITNTHAPCHATARFCRYLNIETVSTMHCYNPKISANILINYIFWMERSWSECISHLNFNRLFLQIELIKWKCKRFFELNRFFNEYGRRMDEYRPRQPCKFAIILRIVGSFSPGRLFIYCIIRLNVRFLLLQ